MAKQVQIDEELFLDLYEYFSQTDTDDVWANEIRVQLKAKLDKMLARCLYTRYKREPTGAEREAARQAYLDHVGILKDYRTDTEYHPSEPSENELRGDYNNG